MWQIQNLCKFLTKIAVNKMEQGVLTPEIKSKKAPELIEPAEEITTLSKHRAVAVTGIWYRARSNEWVVFVGMSVHASVRDGTESRVRRPAARRRAGPPPARTPSSYQLSPGSPSSRPFRSPSSVLQRA